jgi:hypothetical protein
MSEFLREQQGEGEITQQQDGYGKGNHSDEVDLHGLPQLLACLDVEKRHGKENYGEQHHDEILHSRSLNSRPDFLNAGLVLEGSQADGLVST